MKKIISLTIVCLLIACFGFLGHASASDFSIEGTLWRVELKGVVVTKDPLDVEVLNGAMMLGFSGGEMYQCHIIDGDTCTPEPLPEGFDPVIMPNLGLVIIAATGEGCLGYTVVTRGVATMLPRGVGFLTGRQSAWDDQNERVGIELYNGSLTRESETWSP